MRRRRWAVVSLLVALWRASAAPAVPGAGVRVPSEAADAGARSGAAGAKAAAAKPELGDLDPFLEQIMKDWKVPGLAVAVVQDGKMVFSKGYGYRDVGKKLPATPQTLFAIGSITKSFTVTAMGMLVDEGKLDWDAPVRQYLPSFKLYDPVASDRMTPRDLVTHRSGLPRHDTVWYSSNFTRADLVRRLQYLEPSKDFRSAYQYNNMMFMTAGYLVEQVAGTAWEEFVRRRILTPLGMKSTDFSVTDSQQSADFARPYQNAQDVVKEIPFHNIDPIAPAGAINSNVEDMAQYLLFHLNKGKRGDTRLLSENNANQMQMPQMAEPSSERWKELGLPSYGLAFGVSAYRGHKMVSHGGAIDGFTAQFAFLPQDNIGVVALANLNSDRDPVPILVVYNVFDRLLGLDQVPWNQRYKEDDQKTKQSEQEAKQKGFTTRKAGTHPSHDLKDYLGKYENPGYGIVEIEQDGDNLKMSLNLLRSPLRHFHYDVFEVPENPLDPLEKMKVMFSTDLEGDVSSLAIPLQPDVKDIAFTRMPAKVERSFLEQLVGQYEHGGTVYTVSIEGENTLVLLVPGQPKYHLIPRAGTTFSLRELSGFSMEFKKDASGKVTAAVMYEPGTTFVVKRK
jgi:CubicO group peptidase (beta-lactamase class C family)